LVHLSSIAAAAAAVEYEWDSMSGAV
jgi:hypothetical protein